MARNLNKLTAAGIKNETHPGRHSDGGGLYLQVSPTGSASWVFMWKDGGKRTAMGLGPIPPFPSPMLVRKPRCAASRWQLGSIHLSKHAGRPRRRSPWPSSVSLTNSVWRCGGM
ncbi:Arm DNA-binding domain-containing protein [Ensifer adhaerens]|uniref:Arm DNA-binding domain-containing protein n=1 Tax=Ensifer adhaerens TaxID=106592 RepID=UPI003F505837